MQGKINYTPTKISAYVGYFVQAIVNNFLPILFVAFQDIYGIGYEKLGRLIVFNFITQMVTDILSPKIISLLGYRKTAVMCQLIAALGLTLAAVLPNVLPNAYIGIVLAVIVYAFASGLMEVIISPMIEMLPTSNKSGNMSLLHSFYCWGQAITTVGTTLLLSAFGYRGWTYIPLIWAIVPFINAFSFIRVPIVEPQPERKSDSFRVLFSDRRFRVFMLIMLCAGASEIAMAEWASVFAQNALGVSQIAGDLAGPCAFSLFMGLGRLLYAAFSEKISYRSTVIVLGLCCAVCYYIAAFASIPIFALAACALCGFTVSILWPGTISAGAVAFPRGDAVMFSVFAMCGDIGCCIGPWLLGVVAEHFTLNIGFAVSSFFPLLMVALAIFFIKEQRSVSVEKS